MFPAPGDSHSSDCLIDDLSHNAVVDDTIRAEHFNSCDRQFHNLCKLGRNDDPIGCLVSKLSTPGTFLS